jgi:Tfp pilus assembly protein PilO
MYTHDYDKHLRWTRWLIHGTGVLSLVAAGLIYHLVVSSLIAQQREKNKTEIAQLEGFLDQAEETRHEHEQRRKELAELERDAETMRQRIPDQPREAEFLRHVTHAAEEEKLRILKYERGRVTEKKTHSEFEIRVLGEGNYASICGFLDRLADLSRVATVQKMYVTATDPSKDYPLDITLTLYYGARSGRRGE